MIRLDQHKIKLKGPSSQVWGTMFDGGNFLDCYSGTGNMGLEAVSREWIMRLWWTIIKGPFLSLRRM